MGTILTGSIPGKDGVSPPLALLENDQGNPPLPPPAALNDGLAPFTTRKLFVLPVKEMHSANDLRFFPFYSCSNKGETSSLSPSLPYRQETVLAEFPRPPCKNQREVSALIALGRELSSFLLEDLRILVE